MRNKLDLELYLHIPFCLRKCAYGDFLSFAAPEREYRAYVEKLIEEIHGQREHFQEYRVTTIFVGGGTPSILPGELIEELFAAVYACFDVAEDAEITIEANPGTLTMEKLETYLECGVNRLSLGLQSADDQELACLGRAHTYDDFLKSYQRARQAGFTNINVDLMSALPGQDFHSWKTTLRKVLMLRPETLGLQPDHRGRNAVLCAVWGGRSRAARGGSGQGRLPGWNMSGFRRSQGGCSGILDGTGLTGRRMLLSDLPELPDEDTDREIYHAAKEILAEHGYERYEISNYAKPGRQCRHNIGYWTGKAYLGLGLGASSYVFGHRFHNTADLEEYLAADFTSPGAAAQDIQELTLEDRMEEFMFLGLRMMQGVDGSEFLGRFGQNMWNVYGDVFQKLQEQGLIQVEYPVVRLTDLGDRCEQRGAEPVFAGRVGRGCGRAGNRGTYGPAGEESIPGAQKDRGTQRGSWGREALAEASGAISSASRKRSTRRREWGSSSFRCAWICWMRATSSREAVLKNSAGVIWK